MENITLEVENYLLKRQLKDKENELKIARSLINNYYGKNKHDVNKYIEDRKKISENAKRFIQDIVEGKIWKKED